jgi:hypothetical protein
MKKNGYTIVELMIGVFCLSVVFVGIPMLGLWTDRNLDFWLTQFKDKSVDVPYWLSLVVTIIGNAVIVFANVIGEVCRFLV